jgi:hypothetical protein
VLATAVLTCAWLWQPERQVRLHQRHLLDAVGQRDWDKVGGFFDAQYADRWGHDKGFMLRAGREVFRQFLSLQVESEPASCTAGGGRGHISARVRLRGQGGPLAELAVERVNSLHAPFTFEWEQKSWRPWDWTLTRFDQPELEIGATDF